MGRLPILQPEPGEQDPKNPAESTKGGCPGSWYRSAWTASVSHYERHLGDHGFSDNLHLTRSEDRLLLDAVAFLEWQRMRARNHYDRERSKFLEMK